MRQKTCFSVVEMRSENVVFVSENEGSDLGNEGSDLGKEGPDLGIPWPAGPPSPDCPVGWHTDDAPRRHRVRTPARTDDGDFPEDCRGRLYLSAAALRQTVSRNAAQSSPPAVST